MLEVTDLWIYPVKSLHGFSQPESRLGIRGLEFDRNWMVTYSDLNFVTQREIPMMATIQVTLNQNVLRLENEKFGIGLRKPCERCKITTVDQDSGEIAYPKEPLRTFAQLNPFHNLRGAFFGQNATLLSGEGALISTGDRLRVSK